MINKGRRASRVDKLEAKLSIASNNYEMLQKSFTELWDLWRQAVEENTDLRRRLEVARKLAKVVQGGDL